jgi:hypothetical protein
MIPSRSWVQLMRDEETLWAETRTIIVKIMPG